MGRENVKKIGILGGMGPMSTVFFYSELIKKMQREKGAKYNFDYPHMFIISAPIPDTIIAKTFDDVKVNPKDSCFLEKFIEEVRNAK